MPSYQNWIIFRGRVEMCICLSSGIIATPLTSGLQLPVVKYGKIGASAPLFLILFPRCIEI